LGEGGAEDGGAGQAALKNRAGDGQLGVGPARVSLFFAGQVIVLIADGYEDDAVAGGDRQEVGVGRVGAEVLPGQLGASAAKVEFVARG
jgi:hypothetical protein